MPEDDQNFMYPVQDVVQAEAPVVDEEPEPSVDEEPPAEPVEESPVEDDKASPLPAPLPNGVVIH